MSIDLSLERLINLLPKLPIPYRRPTIHIAGTNGKGSVSSLISSILISSTPPLKIGRYNSPHLVSINDCIVIDDEAVDIQLYQGVRTEVERINAEQGTNLSPFEVLTVTALQIFECCQVDVAVIEVGMGGRLDATNIIPSECILVSALTAVDLDHQAFLGNTIEAIAKEKASIARPGRPFVLGPQLHEGKVMPVVRDVVGSVNATLLSSIPVHKRDWDEPTDGPRMPQFSLTSSHTSSSPDSPFGSTRRRFDPPPPIPIEAYLPFFGQKLRTLLPLHGSHQFDNLATALGVINALLTYPPGADEVGSSLKFKERITLETVRNGIKGVKWRGRLSFHTIDIPSQGISGDIDIGEPHQVTQLGSKPKETLVVLVDGAHNPASSTTLSAYITHLIELLITNRREAIINSKGSDQEAKKRSINLTLTYILSLSHSPPKTPLQTLEPLLPVRLPSPDALHDFNVNVDINVALVPFTPPASMPWVKPVPSEELADVVKQLVPIGAKMLIQNEQSDNALRVGGVNGSLEQALQWAAMRAPRGKPVKGVDGYDGGGGNAHGDLNEAEDGLNLVILAGSLYLVADFYRLLERKGE